MQHIATNCNALQRTAMHFSKPVSKVVLLRRLTPVARRWHAGGTPVARRWHAGGTPVAGCILREDILSPNLQAQF